MNITLVLYVCGFPIERMMKNKLKNFLNDDAEKSTSKSHGPHVLKTILAQHTKKRLNREHRCGTGQVPSEGQVRISYNSRVSELGGNYVYLIFWGPLGFYSSVEPTSIICVVRRFLTGKIIINGRVLRNPFYARTLPIMGFYRLGLAMGCKLFPFRISWKPLKSCRSHVNHVEATWPLRPVLLAPVHLGSVRHRDPSTI